MANCCSVTQKNFSNALETNIAYSGTRPKVKVVYLDEVTGIWGYFNPLTRVEISSGNVLVDHGGPATGIIQLIQ